MNGQAKTGLSWPRRYWALVAMTIAGVLLLGHHWLMTPRVNPNPTKKVIVRGEFPFDRGWELRFAQSFYTRNPLCKQMARVFFFIPQAEVSREAWAPPIVPTHLSDSRYEALYYEDYILPGFCDWTERFVYYRIYSGGERISGAALLGFPDSYKEINYECFTHTLPVNTDAKYESGLVCRERFGRRSGSFDPSLPHGEVNFSWKEKRP